MLELHGVYSGYDGNDVCRNISFTSDSPELIALIGPNGSGKSTLLKTVSGLINPSQGNISIDGSNMAEMKNPERAQKVSYLLQSRSVPNISVRRLVLHGRFPYLGYPRRYTAEDISIVEESLRLTGTEKFADKLLPALSGGQQQMAYIAMALAQQTDIILLDEPLTYLDIDRQSETMSLMKRLVSMGKTIITVLHDIPAAMKYADKLIILENGAIVCDVAPDAAYESGVVDRVFNTKLIRVPLGESFRYLCE